jgi:amino acid transporter
MQPGFQPPPGYGMPPGPMETKTEKGLKYINWAFWLYIIVMVVSLLMLLLVFVAIAGGSMGSIFLLVGFGCIIGLLGLIALILWIMGFFSMYSGKDEFGPEHSQKVTFAFMFFVLAIILVIMVVVYAISQIDLTDPGTDSGDPEFYDTDVPIVTIVLGTISTICSSLGWVFLILELSSEDIKKLLWIYFIISVVSAAAGSALSYAYGIVGDAVGGLGIISLVILIFCYWKTYNRVKHKEIVPVTPPMMQPPAFPMGPPPQYPPQYGPPPQYPPPR